MSLRKKILLLIGDVCVLYVSLATTLIFRYDASSFAARLQAHALPFSIVFILWLVVFYLSDLYHVKALGIRKEVTKALGIAVCISGTASIIAFYLFGEFFELTPKTNLLIVSIIVFALEFAWRTTAARIFRSGALGIVMIGDSPLFKETVSFVTDNPGLGYRIEAVIHDKAGLTLQELSRRITNGDIHAVVVERGFAKNQDLVQNLYGLLPQNINLINFADFYESIFAKVPLREVDEYWFIENITPHRPFYDSLKRLSEFIFSGVLLACLFPLALLIGITIGLTSHGPLIYRQERVGKNGKLFVLYKFRTMQNNTSGPLWTEHGNDTRVTAVGGFLRFTHFDEIPQLVNVIKGDISFIGPRPERKELAEQYSKLPHYIIRHAIKPGITGWAQVNFRPSTSLEEAYEKLQYDIYYIKNRSLFLDLIIIVKTIKYVFFSH